MTIPEEKETQEPKTLESYLIAECGTTNTTVALFDLAVGSYRLIAQATAPTTVGEPWLNIMEGVYLAIQRIEAITGRTLLTSQRKLITPS